ncbi:MAG: FHA domain-containing protein [Terriglobia bacterium]
MPKLILKFEARVLREIPVGAEPVGIGRLPDNTVVLDNPAVSGHHARLKREGEQYVLEDLKSTNGTFVNNLPITTRVLRNGDILTVGKHKLVFRSTGKEEVQAPVTTEPAPPPTSQPVQDLGGTVYLDTKAQKELLAKMAARTEAKMEREETIAYTPGAPGAVPPAAAAPAAATPPPSPRIGVLSVVSGSTDKPSYSLEGQTVLIGKSKTALIRLKGWFKPKVAVAITRRGDMYVVTPLAGKSRVNNQPLRQRHQLESGDVLQVSGVTLHFSLTK